MPHMPSIAEQSAVMALATPQKPQMGLAAVDEAVRQATSLADLARRLAELAADV